MKILLMIFALALFLAVSFMSGPEQSRNTKTQFGLYASRPF